MIFISKQASFIKPFTISVVFCFALLAIRIFSKESYFFLFLAWNLFLACIPYGITLLLGFKKIHQNSFLFWTGFIIWLAFIPNSPYILTDLQHLRISTLQSIWFDVLLILSFAINGLIIGFASLRIIQELLRKRFSKKITDLLTYCILLLCGFGIYLGRVLRWNSWDMLTHPVDILADISRRVLFPIQHVHTWAFTAGFGGFLIITYQLLYHFQKERSQK